MYSKCTLCPRSNGVTSNKTKNKFRIRCRYAAGPEYDIGGLLTGGGIYLGRVQGNSELSGGPNAET
jgi:hypothetical protein